MVISIHGAKLEENDFLGDRDPKVFYDWVHSLEAFFRWFRLIEERNSFFAEAKLKRTARVWWLEQQRAIITWDSIKVALIRYFVPKNYRELIWILHK